MESVKSANINIVAPKNNLGTQNKRIIFTNKLEPEENNPSFGFNLKEHGHIKTWPMKILDKAHRWVETGGFIAEFLLVDFIGMIIPRTVQAYNRNKEELGHPNYAAAKEEFTREILSGPSMFVIPMCCLLGARKMFGSASHVKIKMLKEFKEVTKSALEKTNAKSGNIIDNFYTSLVDKLYNGAELGDRKAAIVGKFVNLHKSHPEKAKEAEKKVREALLAANKFVGTNNKLGVSLVDASSMKFGEAKITIGGFVNDCKNYSKDLVGILENDIKGGINVDETTLDKLHKFKEGARKFLTAGAMGTMCSFLLCVPKFYTQNKEYPGLAGLKNNNGGTKV